MLKAITVTNDIPTTAPLINSLAKFGWNAEIICTEWKGFGTKLIATYNYLKDNPEVTEFVFCDAFDVICLGTPQEFILKVHGVDMVCSAEKGLWPPILAPFKSRYPYKAYEFAYINSGLYYAPSELFIALMDENMPSYETDDQFWMNMNWMLGAEIVIDHDQKLFNSHSHMKEGEYGYQNNRLQINGNEPVFVHFNGRTVDEKFNEMIKI